MRRSVTRSILPAILGASLLACATASEPGFSTTPLEPGQILTTTATVRFLNLEGGCWSLDTNKGRFKPLDLPAQFRVDGLQVSVVLKDAPDMADICMIGPLVEIDFIEEAGG